MTTTDLHLATFEDVLTVEGQQSQRTTLWVVGPGGAVTVIFSLNHVRAGDVGRFSLISAYRELPDGGAYEISCRGLVYHWPQHRPLPAGVEPEYADDCLEKEACEFLETHCRHWIGTSLGHNHLQDAMARDDKEHVFGYLKAEYERFFVTGYREET